MSHVAAPRSTLQGDELRRRWLASLAGLVAPTFPGEATQALARYLPFLRGFPDGAFTRGSLEATIDAPRRLAVPSLDELKRAVSTWWKDNRPDRFAALPAPAKREPERSPPTEAELAAVQRTKQELFAHFESLRDPEPETRPIRAAHLSDEALLAGYETLAKSGNAAAAFRAKHLRLKIERDRQRAADGID